MKAFQLIITSFLVVTVWADSQYVLVARMENFFYALKTFPTLRTNKIMLFYDTKDQQLRHKESFVSRGKYIFMKWENHYWPIFFYNKSLFSGETRNPFEFEFDSKKMVTNVDFYACPITTGSSHYFVGQEPDVENSRCEIVDIYFLPVKKLVNEPELPGEEEEIQPNFKPVSNEWMKDFNKYLITDSSEPVIRVPDDIVGN